jgi:outer membrane protein OmpA-like peptidoglycan-associated protein
LRYKGETKTINKGQTDKERAINRRVTIKILSI